MNPARDSTRPRVPRSTGSFLKHPGARPLDDKAVKRSIKLGAKRNDSALLALSHSGRQIDISAREWTGIGWITRDFCQPALGQFLMENQAANFSAWRFFRSLMSDGKSGGYSPARIR